MKVAVEPMTENLLNGKNVSSDMTPQTGTQVPAGKAKKTGRIVTERLRAVLIHFVIGYHIINIGSLYEAQDGLSNNGWNVTSMLFGSSNWPMQIFVLIAGYAAYFNVRSRGGWGFVKERLARLFVPLIFGVFVWDLLVIWLYFLVYETDYGGTFVGYFTKLYTMVYKCWGGDEASCLPYFFTLNLWFIFELFSFSLLCLPLFLVWQRRSPPTLTVSQANWIVGVSCFVVLPILTYGLDVFWWYLPSVGTVSQGNNVLLYLIFFQCGYVLAWSQPLFEAVPRLRWYALALTVVGGYVVGSATYRLDLASFFNYLLDFSYWWEVQSLEIFRIAAMVTVWAFSSSLANVPSLLGKYLDFIAYRVIAIYILNFGMRLAVLLLCEATIYSLYEFDTFLYFLVEFVLVLGSTILVFDVIFNHKYIHGLVGMWRL
mmetsp:Transcript_6059/g.10429  ORF Transcript_6059/g.10429 Transcript_6059/m.10429 type:complete len:428 (+) Transcript_6059:105-1388(+)